MAVYVKRREQVDAIRACDIINARDSVVMRWFPDWLLGALERKEVAVEGLVCMFRGIELKDTDFLVFDGVNLSAMPAVSFERMYELK